MPVKVTLNKDQILQRLKRHEKDIKKFGVWKLGVFGSVIRGEETEESDIDVFVAFRDGQKTFNNFMDLAFYLDNLLEKEVQLVTDKMLSDRLKKNIKKEIEYVTFNS